MANPSGDGSTLASINVALGLFALLLGNMSAVTYGRDSKRTVAIQCRVGLSPGDLFVFDGPFEPSDRYEGRKLAFGTETEILKATRHGAPTYQRLDAAGYNNLLLSARKRFDAQKEILVNGKAANDYIRNDRQLPIWNWALNDKYKKVVSFLYGLLALAPLSLMTLKRIVNKQDVWTEFVYLIIFALCKAYCMMLLCVEREICYIRIGKDQVSTEDGKIRWETCEGSALTGHPINAEMALDDLRSGRVRLAQLDGIDTLLVPVMSLRSKMGFEAAQWWFILRRFRGPALTCSYIFAGNRSHQWAITFAICAFVQAILQDDVARVFLSHTQPYEVNWFTRVKDMDYTEIYAPYTTELSGWL